MTRWTVKARASMAALAVWLLLGGAALAQDATGRGNDAALPESLRDVDIRERFVPLRGVETAGRIDALEGTVVVIHRGTGEAYFGRAGDPVYENDALETLRGSRCRIRFRNEDVVTMASETRFGVDTYREQRETEKPRSLFSMVKGKAMFYALRLFGRRDREVTVKTPTAVAGVRGTKFGVHVYWVEDETAGRAGVRLAALEGGAGMLLGQTPPPGRSFTDCFSEDGSLDVNGQTVTPGSMFRGRDGAVVPTPPGYVRSFEAQTSVRGGGPGGAGPGTGSGDDPAGDEEGDGDPPVTGDGSTTPAASAGVADMLADTTVQETGIRTQESDAAGGGIAEGRTAGRVSGIAMLLVKSMGFPWHVSSTSGPFYVHGPNPLGDGADTHVAYELQHEGDADYRLVLQETDATGSKAQVTEFDYGSLDPTLPTPLRTFTYFQGGSYKDASGHSFLEWGWWEDTQDDGKIGESGAGWFLAATRKIWHVEGDRTHPDYIDYLQEQGAVFSYSGGAHGVFVDESATPSPAAEPLAGSFSCNIDFGSRQVSSFKIDASGGGYDVHLSGSGTVDANGELDVDDLTGTLSGHIVQDEPTGAGGVVLGAEAEGVAGAWHAHDGSHYWATGEFHGRR
jgi:hypothetical protein